MRDHFALSLLLFTILTGPVYANWGVNWHGNKQNDREDDNSLRNPDKIVTVARKRSDLSTFVSLSDASNLTKPLERCSAFGCDFFTVFAPNDDAFAELESAEATIYNRFTTDIQYKKHLRKLLEAHAIRGKGLTSAEIANGKILNTVEGDVLEITKADNVITVNGSTVVDADIQARNGYIHVIDTVITPEFVTGDIPVMALANGFTEFTIALIASDVDSEISEPNEGFTVFSPTNEAFLKLNVPSLPEADLKRLIQYHVVPNNIILRKELADGQLTTLSSGDTIDVEVQTNYGRKLTWGNVERKSFFLNGRDVKIKETNILASNGVIHEIDCVLIPDGLTVPDLATIGTQIQANDDFTELASALETAGLISLLEDETKEYTLFAPTNDAIAAAGTTPSADILRYHVVDGKILRKDFKTGQLPTLSTGNDIDVYATSFVARLNGVTKLKTFDIQAKNGVIHVIDRVLDPSASTSSVAVAAGTSDRFTTLLAAIDRVPHVKLLLKTGAYTLLAPNDEACARFGLTEYNNADLEKILDYHLVKGYILYRDFRESQYRTALSGKSVSVEIRYQRSYQHRRAITAVIDGYATVEACDVPADFGVMHEIDKVLIPK